MQIPIDPFCDAMHDLENLQKVVHVSLNIIVDADFLIEYTRLLSISNLVHMYQTKSQISPEYHLDCELNPIVP